MTPTNPNRWTLQIVPEGSGRTRSVQVSRWGLAGAATAGLVVVLLALVFLTAIGHDAARNAELAQLRTENRHLTENLRQIRTELGGVEGTLDYLSAQEERFRVIAGLPYIDPEVREVGIGGPVIASATREEFFKVSPSVAANVYDVALDIDRLSRRAELLTESLAEAIDSATVRQQVFLARPSIMPVDGEDAWISSSFSRSRFHPILLYNRPHFGIDIAALEGTPIRATANGTVVYAGNKAGYGKTIEIDHGFGYQTVYAHAKSISVRRGQQVLRGDVIGEVGQSGLASAPNLHYEVLVEERAVNPRRYLLEDVELVE